MRAALAFLAGVGLVGLAHPFLPAGAGPAGYLRESLILSLGGNLALGLALVLLGALLRLARVPMPGASTAFWMGLMLGLVAPLGNWVHELSHRELKSNVLFYPLPLAWWAATRLPRLLEKHRPAIVLLELGGNDGLRGLPVEVTRSNLSAMIEQSQAAGAEVILAEMRIPPNYGRSYTEKFNDNYTLLQRQYGIVMLPFVLQEIALEKGLMQSDGIHPTAEAQPLILEQVWRVLRPLL